MSHPLNLITGDSVLPPKADVVIIGAGIVGITAALDLARNGLKVAVVEKGLVAAEQSSRNWGWVRQQGRDRRELPLIVESLKIWESLQNEADIELGFRRTGLFSLSSDPAELARWQRWAVNGRAAGITVDELSATEAEAAFPGGPRPWIGGLHTPTDAQAEPAIATPALAEAARSAGTTLHQQTAVRGLEITNGAVTGVITEKGRIAAPAVLVAAGAWSSLLLRQHGIRLPQINVRSTVVRTTEAPEVIHGTFCSTDFCLCRRQDNSFTLTLRGDETFDLSPDGFRFFRDFIPVLKRNHGDVKIRFGSAFFSTIRNERRRALSDRSVYEEIRTYDPPPDTKVVRKALARFKQGRPELAAVDVAESWAGRIDMTPDLIPVISKVPSLSGVTVATGFSGHGFGIGPGAGRLASDLVRNASPIVDPTPFRITRFSDGTPIFLDPDVI